MHIDTRGVYLILVNGLRCYELPHDTLRSITVGEACLLLLRNFSEARSK